MYVSFAEQRAAIIFHIIKQNVVIEIERRTENQLVSKLFSLIASSSYARLYLRKEEQRKDEERGENVEDLEQVSLQTHY